MEKFNGAERRRLSGVQRLIAVAGVAILGLLTVNTIVGDGPAVYSDEEIAERTADDFASYYDRMSDTEKVAFLYSGAPIDGERTYLLTGSTKREPHKVVELMFTAPSLVSVYYGQTCMSRYGYSLLPTEVQSRPYATDEIPPRALPIPYPDGKIGIRPVGSSEADLLFKRSPQSPAFVPANEFTRDSLRSQGCNPDYDPFIDGPKVVR